MIYDQLTNLKQYENCHPEFKAAFAFIEQLMKDKPEDGKHILNDNVFVNVVSKSPIKEEKDAKMESHEKYIDIQIVLEGKEKCYVYDGDLTPTVAYDETKDAAFYAIPNKDDCVTLTLQKGYFAIFFTNEKHAPSISFDKEGTDFKYIAKIKK